MVQHEQGKQRARAAARAAARFVVVIVGAVGVVMSAPIVDVTFKALAMVLPSMVLFFSIGYCGWANGWLS